MAPSHSPAALPHLMLPRLGRSVSAFVPPHRFAESPPQPPFPCCPGQPCGGIAVPHTRAQTSDHAQSARTSFVLMMAVVASV